MSGTLRCVTCHAVYQIARGVPRMNTSMSGLERVAQTFSYEWGAHHAGKLEREETLWGLTNEEYWNYFLEATGFEDGDLDGKTVLDAGCGSGCLTRMMAENGARTVIGVDIIEAVDGAFQRSRHMPNVHIVQGNLFQLPLRKKAFDLVWSNGVIHHTPDARGAHEALAQMVRPGGLLYVWVYAKRFNPFRFTKDVLDFLRVTRLPEPVLLRISRVFAYVSAGLHRAYKGIRRLPPFRPRSRWAKRTMRRRTVDELTLTWFDSLSPEYDSRHSETEVIAWFARLGFHDIATIEEPKVGVRGVAPRV
jgi:SAM-dependent methyltransferase